jgi:hypothetical protein
VMWRRPVRDEIAPIAIASAGLSIGPVSNTAFDPADRNCVTISVPTTVQLDAIAAWGRRRSDNGPRARSGS